jgi:cytochrome c oxidase subunit 1
MDRLAGTSFFLPTGLVVSGQVLPVSGGGSPVLWQHLFWFLAHPEVYVLILPGLGIVAEVIANTTRRPLWGYKAMVGSALFMGLMSFLVWAHHMFLTGMGPTMSAFFQVTTMIISVPSVVIVSSLLLSLYGGSIRFTVPGLFALAFLPMFGIGGLTGLPLDSRPPTFRCTTPITSSATFTTSWRRARCSPSSRASTTGSRKSPDGR